MVERSTSFENLAAWDDLNVVGAITDEEQNPTQIDPRPTPSEIIELDRTVSELEASLDALKLRRASILASRALVTRIPPELLARIFELGVHTHLPLLSSISLVSRQWRALTLATPVLWSYIRLDHTWGYGRTPAFVQKLEMHLVRSQACKILVDIDFRYLDVYSDVITIMAALGPHLHRCFFFRASVSDWDWMTGVREQSATLGPCLEELYLRIDPSDAEDQTPVTFLSIPCPRLHTIVLEHAPLTSIRAPIAPPAPDAEADAPEDLPPIDLSAVRKLHLIFHQRYHSSSRIGVSFRELLSTLVATPALEDLRIQSTVFLYDGCELLFQPAPVPTTIPALASLSFHFLDSLNIEQFLQSTWLPRLHRLSVQMESNNEENLAFLAALASTPPHPALLPSLPLISSQPRFPALRTLDLRACNTDGPALPAFVRALHALPQLTALALSSPPSGVLGPKLFDLLADGRDGWIVPRLRALCVQNCRDVSGHELLRVVCARAGAGGEEVCALEYLRVSQCYALDPEVVDQLRGLVLWLQTT